MAIFYTKCSLISRVIRSGFVRPDAADLEARLEDYCLVELWEKNVIGGGPH